MGDQPGVTGRLNTEDLKKGLTFIATSGKNTNAATAKDFEYLFAARAKALGFVQTQSCFKLGRRRRLARPPISRH